MYNVYITDTVNHLQCFENTLIIGRLGICQLLVSVLGFTTVNCTAYCVLCHEIHLLENIQITETCTIWGTKKCYIQNKQTAKKNTVF